MAEEIIARETQKKPDLRLENLFSRIERTVNIIDELGQTLQEKNDWIRVEEVEFRVAAKRGEEKTIEVFVSPNKCRSRFKFDKGRLTGYMTLEEEYSDGSEQWWKLEKSESGNFEWDSVVVDPKNSYFYDNPHGNFLPKWSRFLSRTLMEENVKKSLRIIRSGFGNFGLSPEGVTRRIFLNRTVQTLGAYLLIKAGATVSSPLETTAEAVRAEWEGVASEVLEKEIEEMWGIDVEIEGDNKEVSAVRKLLLFREQLKIFPPELFDNLVSLAKLAESRTDDDEMGKYYRWGERVKFKLTDSLGRRGNGVLVGDATLETGEVNLALTYLTYWSLKESMPHEIGHLLSWVLTYVHEGHFTAFPLSVFVGKEVRERALSENEAEKRKIREVYRNFPGFLSDTSYYSLVSDFENSAMFLGKVLTDPVWAMLVATGKEESEKKVKVITAMRMWEVISGGLMDGQYFKDLALGKVRSDYWKNKETFPRHARLLDSERAFYITDLSGSPSEVIPASVEVEKLDTGNDLIGKLTSRKDLEFEFSGKDVKAGVRHFNHDRKTGPENWEIDLFWGKDLPPVVLGQIKPGELRRYILRSLDKEVKLMFYLDPGGDWQSDLEGERRIGDNLIDQVFALMRVYDEEVLKFLVTFTSLHSVTITKDTVEQSKILNPN